MVNFYPEFINCTNPDDATLEQVAGEPMPWHAYMSNTYLTIKIF